MEVVILINDNFIIQVKKADNGYVVCEKRLETEEDGREHWEEEVFVFDDKKEDGEHEAMKDMLLKVAELCGEFYEKYGSENLNINWDKKGHKL